MKKLTIVSLCIVLALVTQPGCERRRNTHEDLDATLWMQTSAEYQAACRQAYRLARQQLAAALKDSNWSADLVQQAQLTQQPTSASGLTPAVILDVDETVLDNSPYQARTVRSNGGFGIDSWHAWVREANAKPVPGVLEFVKAARELGVEVYFVTNREVVVENATRRNLEALGLSLPNAPDRILSKHERDAWSSDKSTRREFVGSRHRILLLIGDDLNDFVSVGFKPTPEARRELARQHAKQWGIKWISLPNANYGGWERSVYNWEDSASDAIKLQRKQLALNLAEDDSEKAEE